MLAVVTFRRFDCSWCSRVAYNREFGRHMLNGYPGLRDANTLSNHRIEIIARGVNGS